MGFSGAPKDQPAATAKMVRSSASGSIVRSAFDRQHASWPEKGERKLQWLSRAKAAKTVEDRVLGTNIRTLPKGK
jgi:hypothetical protein